MALQSHYGQSFDLVSNITKRKAKAMEDFMRGQYEDNQILVDSDKLIGFARREAIGKMKQSVMWKQTVAGPDGRTRPVSAEFYIQYVLRRMWYICCHDQCGIAFKDAPPIPIKLMDVDEDGEGLRAPEHIRDLQSKEKKEQYENERVERAKRAEEKAKTLSRRDLEERHKREIQELNAAHLKEIQDRKAQTLLNIENLKDTIGQRQANDNQKSCQR